MHFDLNDDQKEIKRVAHELLSSRSPWAKVREVAEAGQYDDALWSEIVSLGWPGISVPEEHGGQGLGLSSSRCCSRSSATRAPLRRSYRRPRRRPRSPARVRTRSARDGCRGCPAASSAQGSERASWRLTQRMPTWSCCSTATRRRCSSAPTPTWNR